MMHEVRGDGFHGGLRLKFRGPANGWVLSETQAARFSRAACPWHDCTCGGRIRFARDSARIMYAYELTGREIAMLPAGERIIAEKCPDRLVLLPARA